MLQVEDVGKSFGNEQVLTNISLTLEAGQTLSILGASGSGKTTLLRGLAGLLNFDKGRISWNKGDITTVPPQDRGVVYLYQEPLLFPHLSVFDNIAFGLTVKGRPRKMITTQVNSLIEELGLTEHAHKSPEQLSGGQQQRVNFGRALIIEPKVLLLDEPFGNLDAQTRIKMQELYLRISREHHITSLFVTHDVKEALGMGDQWATLHGGQLQTFSSQAAFIADESTGAQEEIRFWQNVQTL